MEHLFFKTEPSLPFLLRAVLLIGSSYLPILSSLECISFQRLFIADSRCPIFGERLDTVFIKKRKDQSFCCFSLTQ